MSIETKTRAATCATKAPWLSLGHRRFVVRECNLEIASLSPDLEGLRILHVSDIHLRTAWHPYFDRVIAAIEQMEVDLILCTGDIVDNRHDHRPAMPQVRRLMPALKSRLGSFTILGNHDSPLMLDDLEQMGINTVSGRSLRLPIGDAELELLGTPGCHRVDLPAGFAAQFPAPTFGVPRIVMAHFPDQYPKLLSLEPDLYLCGHTHGGQVCLPGGIPLMRHDRSPRHLCRGQHRRGKTHYIVNHGLGFSGFDVRLFCPAEMVLITLLSAS